MHICDTKNVRQMCIFYLRFSIYSSNLNPKITLFSVTKIGLFINIPSLANNLIFSSSDINGNFSFNFAKDFLDKYSLPYSEHSLLEKGQLSDHAKVIIKDALKDGVNHIHLAGADILTYDVIDFLNQINRNDVPLSCCNNFKMCCGEGICGACTARFSGHRVKRFCKEQLDPRAIFEGRRFI